MRSEDSVLWQRWMCILVLTLFLVYALFFGLVEKHNAKPLVSDVEVSTVFAESSPPPAEKTDVVAVGWAQQDTMQMSDPEVYKPDIERFVAHENDVSEDTWWSVHAITDIASDADTPPYIVSVQALFDNDSDPIIPQDPSYTTKTHQGVVPLSGTRQWSGTMKSATLLQISPSIQYILKNMDNTHFAYLGDTPPDITRRVEELWWNTVAISSKNDIEAHWLFGDIVILINVPSYAGIKRLLFVSFKSTGDRRYLQIDEDAYMRSKQMIRDLFASWYDF